MNNDIYLSWEKEFSGLDLGDQRLTDRFLTVLNDFSAHPPASIFESSHGEKSKMKAAYRLMNQEKLEVEKIWSHHQQKTLKRAQKHPVVLVISDTTTFNFDSHLNVKGLGRIGTKGKNVSGQEFQGLLCHNIIAVTPDKLPIGILDQKIFSRGEKRKASSGKKIYPKNLPHLEKESSRWSLGLVSAVRGSENQATNFIAVSDRESDINAYLGTALDLDVNVLVRSTKTRIEHSTHTFLKEFMQTLPSHGEFKLEVIKRNQKTNCRRNPVQRLKHAVYRTAEIEVRWSEVEVQVENIYDEKRIETFKCVYASEKNPVDQKDAIDWLLVTSLPVTSMNKAKEIIQYYGVRWIIEVFHKMLKTGGCDIERCGLQTKERLERYITMESLVAIKLTQLTYYQRCNPDVPCTELVDDLTWQTAYCMTKKTKDLPSQPPTAHDFTIMVASLGGYLNRNNDPTPGGIILRRGWERLQDMKETYAMFKC